MTKQPDAKPEFVVCINSGGYPASLELHKIYRVLPDEDAAAELWVQFFDQLCDFAGVRLQDFPQRSFDNEDVALSAIRSRTSSPPESALAKNSIHFSFTVFVQRRTQPDLGLQGWGAAGAREPQAAGTSSS